MRGKGCQRHARTNCLECKKRFVKTIYRSTMTMNTCRLCGKSEYGDSWMRENRGPLYKYGVRHHAHFRCAIEKWGVSFLDKLPDWRLGSIPYFLAKELGLLDELRRRLGMAPNGSAE